MRDFIFNYTVTPYRDAFAEKEPDFWIDILNQYEKISAENVGVAIKTFAERLSKGWCVDITKKSLDAPNPMFDDKSGDKAIGYVFKARTDIDFDNEGMKQRYVDVWTTIIEAVTPELKYNIA